MPFETTSIVIMGASGDLTSRKLLPALFNLFLKARLPREINMVGMSRSPCSDEEFRERMWRGVRRHGAVPGRLAALRGEGPVLQRRPGGSRRRGAPQGDARRLTASIRKSAW